MKKNIGIQMNNIDKFFSDSEGIKDFAESYLDYLSSLLKKIDLNQIVNFVNALQSARDRNSSIYFIGNGGSAATASHFANDILIGTRSNNKPFRAQSLCDNQAILTAIANDDGFDQIFSQQLDALAKKDDLVVGISASGNSSSIINALDIAKKRGAITVGLTAFDGGKVKSMVDISLHVPTIEGEYGPAEDIHMIFDHLISNYLMRFIRKS